MLSIEDVLRVDYRLTQGPPQRFQPIIASAAYKTMRVEIDNHKAGVRKIANLAAVNHALSSLHNVLYSQTKVLK